MTCGHCCRFAGSITVEAGRVLKVTPHSGHYVPTQAEYDSLVAEWRRERGTGLEERPQLRRALLLGRRGVELLEGEKGRSRRRRAVDSHPLR